MIVRLSILLVDPLAESCTEKVKLAVPAVPASGVPVIAPVEGLSERLLGKLGVTPQLM